MSDDLHHQIKALLGANGAMGVNQLQKEIDIPLSTLQKYLDKQQTYFKKNASRKWVLPEMAVNSDIAVVSANYGNVIDSQLMSMNALIETLMSQFKATVTLIEAHKPNNIPVAAKVPNAHPSIKLIDSSVDIYNKTYKQFNSKVPEVYADLLKNVNIHLLCVTKGTNWFDDVFATEIGGLFLEEIDELSNDVIEVLKKCQKEK